MSSAEVTLADATALTRHGWELLCQGRCQEAIEEFSRAIKLDENFAEAYNNRSIGKQIAGEDAADDASVADALTMHDAEAQIKLRQQRKWMCVGYNARGEPEGEKIAADADFLISFASPDRDENNRILQELKTGVYYDGSLRPVTFCTDKSLGMGLHINEGQDMKRWNPIFADLDQPRQPGEYPPWFKHYKKAAEKTRHGLLILQLTDSYLKSKACRWEFGYVRKPELVHVYVPGGDASPGRIVKWEELMDDAELCRQLFREALNHMFPANLDAEDPSKDATSGTLMRLEKMAETAEEQEHQAWCELPFRQLAYSFAKKSFTENSAKAMASAHELLLVYLQTGFAARAKNLGKDLLETMERTIPQGPAVATLLTHLSNAHGKLGEYSQQKDLLERALKIKEQHYGKEHPSVAVTLTNLASAHGSFGEYSQQKDLLERALKIKEQQYGKEHPEVAIPLTNLGNFHGSLGDYGRQKDLLERALKIKEQQYGKEHPEVAIILTSLGNAHGSLGHYRLKKDLLESALKINEQHYGKDHPEVAVTLISLGNAHGIMGDYGLKKDLLERALKIKEQHYGKEHPEVAIALTNLGNAHGRLGDYRLMKDMLERALKVAEQHYGKEHPFVAIPLTNLGNVHGVLGNYGQQKELLERALKIKEQHLGKEHPEVADTLTNLSNFHGSLGDYGQQKDLLERALNVLEQHYGKEHPRVAVTLTSLGKAHGSLSNYRLKKDLLERALNIHEQHYGKEHPEVAVTLTNLGNAHGSLSNYRLKQDLLERALNINEQHYGKEHPEVAVTLYNLGLAYYQDTGDCARAKECVERALKIFVQHSHPYANRAETALHGLAQVPFQGSVVQRVKTRMMQIFRKWRLGS